MSLPLLNKRIL